MLLFSSLLHLWIIHAVFNTIFIALNQKKCNTLSQAAEELCMLSCLSLPPFFFFFFPGLHHKDGGWWVSPGAVTGDRWLTLVESGGAVYVSWDEGGLWLLPHRVIPHPPDAALLRQKRRPWSGLDAALLLFKASVPEDQAGSWFKPKFVYGNPLKTGCLLMRLCYGKTQTRLLIRMIWTPNLSARNLRKQPSEALSALEVEAESAVRFPEVLLRYRTRTFSGLVFQ